MINYANLVNINVGTDSEYRESNGNTLPNVQWPFGNQAYVMQSNKNSGGWFYKPHANYTEGVRITNQPSPWLGDYGHMTLLPYNGKYDVDLHTSLTEKKALPYVLGGNLNRYNTSFKLVPTRYGAKMSVTNNKDIDSKLLIDCHGGTTDYQICENRVYITNRNIPDSEYAKNYRKYYVISFDTSIKEVIGYVKGMQTNQTSSANLQLEIVLDGSEYDVNIVSSYIDFEYAKYHLQAIENEQISNLEIRACEEWNKYLGTIKVEEAPSEFYSNMYRLFCYPRVISEEKDGVEVFYNFKTGEVNSGSMITDVGFWDTYRTTMPLYKLLVPTMYKKMIDAIINYYKSYGWLPRWLAPYERGIMPSTLVDSVIAQALVDGDIDDVPTAIEALIKDGEEICTNNLFGREHLAEYIELGYVSQDANGESVSVSLDNYYSDYAIYKALAKYNHNKADEYKQRSMNYSKIFNPQSKLFERVNKLGEFDPTFRGEDWGYDFCESSAYQNNLSVFHDIEGMIKLFGGKDELEKRLDMLTTSKPEYGVGRYGFEIHEMTEYSKIRDLGHFAISNQPSFNIPFWYLHVDKEDKFNALIDRALNHFTNNDDGYPGDEDNGSLAAWYILVSIGKYPFCPVDGMIEFKPRVKYKIDSLK